VNATATGADYNNNSPGIGLVGDTGSLGNATIDITSPNVTATASTIDLKGYAPAIGASDAGATITSLTYPVAISGGGTGATVSGSYSALAPVDINAGVLSGYSFVDWTTTSANVVFDNATSATTFFSIPVDEVTISGPMDIIATWYEDLFFTDSASYDIPASTVGTAIAPIDVSGGVSGGTTPYAFSASGLPAGLSIYAATGVISGTPTTATAAGTATITATDSVAATKNITINYGAVSAAIVLPVVYPVTTHFGTFTGTGTATARIDGTYAKFLRLEYNGSIVDPSNYTTWEGSTYIQLTEAYLKTYANGAYHSFIAVYSDGTSENIHLDVNVAANKEDDNDSNDDDDDSDTDTDADDDDEATSDSDTGSPKTNDEAALSFMLILSGGALLALLMAVIAKVRKRKQTEATSR
jgi:hypothetical protein